MHWKVINLGSLGPRIKWCLRTLKEEDMYLKQCIKRRMGKCGIWSLITWDRVRFVINGCEYLYMSDFFIIFILGNHLMVQNCKIFRCLISLYIELYTFAPYFCHLCYVVLINTSMRIKDCFLIFVILCLYSLSISFMSGDLNITH